MVAFELNLLKSSYSLPEITFELILVLLCFWLQSGAIFNVNQYQVYNFTVKMNEL